MSGAKKYFILLLISGASLLVPLSASASILWAGGEDSSFTPSGISSVQASTDSGVFDSRYAREAVDVPGTSSADPPPYYYTSATFTPSSNFWIHAKFYTHNASQVNNAQALLVYSPDGVARILLRQTGTAGVLKVSTRNAAGTITDLATASSAFYFGSLNKLDLHINYTCSSSGGVTLYINDVQVINWSGNPCTDSATNLDQIALGTVAYADYYNTCDTNGGTSGTCWSEVIVSNTDTRGMSLWTLPPQAAGNTQSWTPNTVGNINPTSINDSNFIQTASSSELSEWTTPTSAPAGSWIVDALVQEARVLAGTSGPQHFEWLVRTKDGTDNVASSTAATQGGFFNFTHVWSLNPKTGLSWLLSDIATGFNTGIESLP